MLYIIIYNFIYIYSIYICYNIIIVLYKYIQYILYNILYSNILDVYNIHLYMYYTLHILMVTIYVIQSIEIMYCYP